MTYVITTSCVDIKDMSCIEECPVDCIYEGDRKLYIQPKECIDCGACEPVCPVDAIYPDRTLPSDKVEDKEDNRVFFYEVLPGRDEPLGSLDRRLRPEMVDQITWHRESGHELVLVSASLGAYLRPFARDHGFDHVIAVELEVGESGHLTGAMAGPNVRGPEKAVRLRSWLDGEEPELLWAYGNSSGDRELLELADVPVWVAGRQRATTAPPSGAGGRAVSVAP